jgi:hypothetical protein
LSLLVNSDIFLTDSISHLIENIKKIQDEKRFVALSRYNPVPNGIELNSNPHWTQDTWGIVKGKEVMQSALLQETSFELGQPGCDNKIAYVMSSYGYTVTNPCLKVVTIHLQAETNRNYDAKSSKLIGLHAFVHPTNSVLEDSFLEFDLLTRNRKDISEIRVNNWINERKSYTLEAKNFPNNQVLYKKPEYIDVKKTFKKNIELLSELSNNKNENYILLKDFEISKFKLIAKFSDRFLVYSDAKNFYFYDRYWPLVRFQPVSELVGVSFDDKSPLFFVIAFFPVMLELNNMEISPDMKYPEDIMFWQFPCKTEGDAYERHKNISNRLFKDGVVDVYLPMPWATFIDKKKYPESYLHLLSSKIYAGKKILDKFEYKLKIHTVCQHIRWRNTEAWVKKIGVTDLWISHKEKGVDKFFDINLHSWSLYAVNYLDKSRSTDLIYKPIKDKKIFASFIGAHMKHYISDVRLKLVALKELNNYVIEIKDLWHFNKVVYNYQVHGQEKEKNSIESDEVIKYNKLISDSIFSLCPVGAGPNTLRLWESLAVGSIPVVLSDMHEMPTLDLVQDGQVINWDDIVIFHPENLLTTLNDRLKAISEKELIQRQKYCILAFNKLLNKTIF